MRVVHSFWSRPAGAYHWPSIRHFLYSQLISVKQAQKVYGNIHLITDRVGAELFRSLDFGYTSYTVNLDGSDIDPKWWIWGKLQAYKQSAERGPFIHIDGDTYLWDKLPAVVESADLICQSFERKGTFIGFDHIYDTPRLRLEASLPYMPKFWIYNGDGVAVNAGIFGGSNTGTIRRYVDACMDFIKRPEYQNALASEGYWTSVMVEQQFAYSIAKYEGASFTSLLDNLPPDPNQTVYMHAMGHKREAEFCERVRARAEREYPDHYATINARFGPAETTLPDSLLSLNAAKVTVKEVARAAGSRGGCGCSRGRG